MPAPAMQDDPLDALLNLEERYYDDGFKQGYHDGQRQSRLEARVFGVEKGFEKFVEMGKIRAKASVWAARIDAGSNEKAAASAADRLAPSLKLPVARASHRAKQHVETLQSLLDPSSVSSTNSDQAVSDFDERLKRANAKAKVIEKLLGESSATGVPATKANRSGNMEDFA